MCKWDARLGNDQTHSWAPLIGDLPRGPFLSLSKHLFSSSTFSQTARSVLWLTDLFFHAQEMALVGFSYHLMPRRDSNPCLWYTSLSDLFRTHIWDIETENEEKALCQAGTEPVTARFSCAPTNTSNNVKVKMCATERPIYFYRWSNWSHPS